MRSFIGGVGWLLAASLAAAAQTDGTRAVDAPPPADAEAEHLFVETVDVNVVNVDVYVTDKKGNRITGLTRDDFELSEDGHPVEITNFYAVEGGKVRAGGTPEPPPPRPASDPAAAVPPSLPPAAAPTPEDQQLYLAVYVDNFNLRPFTRKRVLGFVRTFLRRDLTADDQVMLVTYDRSFHVRQPFTRNKELVVSALYDLDKVSAQGTHTDSERREVMGRIYDDNSIGVDPRAAANGYAESLFSDLGFTLDALKEFAGSLAGLPGRKAILYVSDGLPMKPGEDVFYALAEKFDTSSTLVDSFRFDASRRFLELVNQANSDRVTFYTIDASGLRSYTYNSAENAGPGGGPRIDQIHFANLQTPLHLMAEETGGVTIVNTNNYAPLLAGIAEDFNTYYSLGYSPAGTGGGRFHKIEVKVKGRKDLRVRHRAGYRDKPLETRMAESTMAALHYGYQKNPLGVELEAKPGQPQDDGRYVVPLLVRIPIAGLSFLPREEMRRGRLQLFVAAQDSEGGVAPVQQLAVPVDISNGDFEAARDKRFVYVMNLRMRRGPQVVAVGVRDEIGAVTSFVTQGLTVGP